MNNEEIDYWLRLFSNNNHGFMSKDGKKITLFKVFQELKELHYLLKIKNDYINELQQENQSLEKENKILRENAEHNDKVVDIFYDANDNVMEVCVLGSIEYDNNEIKSIVTKEQFESMSYKVGE